MNSETEAMVTTLIPSPKIEISKQNVLSRFGYRDRPPTTEINKRVESLVREANTYIDPITFYKPVGIRSVSSQSVTLEGSESLNSERISYVLSNCESVVIFAVTIGPRLEQEVATYIETGNMFEAFVLDASGSTAAEGLADHLSQHVKNIVRKDGQKTTDRYSPGYCEWSLDEQDIIFRILECDGMAIELNDSKLMIPHKSVSGVIGVTNIGNRILSPCPKCEFVDNCLHRRYPQ